MEKFLSFVLTLAIIFALVWGVMYEDDFEKALDMLEVNNAYQAYILLYEEKDENEEAKEMLKNFKIVYKNMEETDPDGNVTTTERTYDENGNLITSVVTSAKGTVNRFEYSYNDKNDLVKYTRTQSKSAFSEELVGKKYTYEYDITYDSDGRKIKSVFTSDYIADNKTEEYSYDSRGNEIKVVTTYSDGACDVEEKSYDSKGNMVKSIKTFKSGTVSTSTGEYTYNSDNKRTYSSYVNSNGVTYTYEYSYDSKGNLTKTLYNHSNGNSETIEYTYNEIGERTKMVETDSEGKVTTTTYSDYLYFYIPDGIPE